MLAFSVVVSKVLAALSNSFESLGMVAQLLNNMKIKKVLNNVWTKVSPD